MNIRDFAVVIVRFFGLSMLYGCIHMAEQVISLFYIPFADTSLDYNRFIAAGVFNLFLELVIGFMLTWKPQLLADRMLPSAACQSEIKTTSTELIFLGFVIAGVVFIVSGLKTLVYQTVVWLSVPSGPMFQTNVDRAAVATGIFETAIGLWLLFGFKGIFRGIRRGWKAGRTWGKNQRDDAEHKEQSGLKS
jgi:hypothetical protein